MKPAWASPALFLRRLPAGDSFAALLVSLFLANHFFWLVAPGTALPVACMLVVVAVTVLHLLQEAGQGRYIMLFATVIGLLLLFFAPLNDWDARSIWFFHAKRMYFDGSLLARLDGYIAGTHPAYPDLVPAVAASIARVFGVWNEYLPKTALIIALVPPFAVLLARPASLPARLLLLGSILYITRGHLLGGSMDAPLAVYVAAGAILIGRVREGERSTPAIVASALFLCAIAVIKNEGLATAGILALPLFLAIIRGTNPRAGLARLLSVGAAGGLPLAIWTLRARLAGVDNGFLSGDPWARVTARLTSGDFGHILHRVGDAIFAPVVVLLAVMLLRRRLEPLTAWFVAAYAAVLVGVYLVTPYDLAWHLSFSIGRVTLVIKVLIAVSVILELEKLADSRP